MFGTSATGNAGMMLSNNCLILPSGATTSGTYRLDVSGDARVTGTLTTGGVNWTGDLSAPNISTSGILTLSHNSTSNNRFRIINNNFETFTINKSGYVVIKDNTAGSDPVSTATGAYGTITLKNTAFADVTGYSSIVFQSSKNFMDFAYIKYFDVYNNPDGFCNSRLVIGVESDAFAPSNLPYYYKDCVVIATPQMKGYVGINKIDPTTNLDISGNTRISENLEVSGNITCAKNVHISGNLEVNNISLSNIIRLGTIEVKSVASSNNNLYLSFPLPETVLCDCNLGNMNLYMPDVASIPTTATCKLYIRRINPNATVINLYPYTTNDYVFYNYVNQLVNSITGIGWVNIWLILYNRKWYFSQYEG